MKCVECKMYDPVDGCYGEPDEEGYCEQIEYEMASDMRDYCETWEPTYNPEDGSM